MPISSALCRLKPGSVYSGGTWQVAQRALPSAANNALPRSAARASKLPFGGAVVNRVNEGAPGDDVEDDLVALLDEKLGRKVARNFEDSRRLAARLERTVAALADEVGTDWYSARRRFHARTTPALTGSSTGSKAVG